MMKKTSKYLLALLFGASLCGCISHDETVYRNPERVKVEFENEIAARIFYEALSKYPSPEKQESNTSVEIPVIFEHHRRVVNGENVAFNNAVRDCDTNQDGKITEQEARIFSEMRERRSR